MASATRSGSAVSTARGPAVRHRAVRAGARADVAENHERRGAVVPALADVRALRLFAHRVQLQLAHQALEPQVARRAGRAHLQPLGLRAARRRGRGGRQRNDAGHFSVLYRPVALFHHVDLRVMWPDTDPAGIVWFGVFFRYFENAEEDLYRRLGSDRTTLLRSLNVFMPRTSLQSRFRSPAQARRRAVGRRRRRRDHRRGGSASRSTSTSAAPIG